MDRKENKLTPTKITRLLQLAESRTPQQVQTARRRVLAEKNSADRAADRESGLTSSREMSKHNTPSESTGGILDLDQLEGFGDSCIGMSMTSSLFNPGEMTGRSTGANECDNVCGSAAIDELTARLQQQSCEVSDIVRQSVCNNYTFASVQPDLSKDEISFARERGDLPVLPSQLNLNITHADKPGLADTTADMSVGSYFMRGSQNIASMIGGRAESPSYDMSTAQSVMEDSRTYGVKPAFQSINDTDCAIVDTTLDHVPTRDPTRPANANIMPGGAVTHVAPALCAPQIQRLLQPNSNRSNEDSSLGMDASLSISLIAKCLGKCDAEVTPSMIFAEAKKKRGQKPEPPQRETPFNARDTFSVPNSNWSRPLPVGNENPNYVATLKQTGRTDTGSSAGSVNTVINVSKNKEPAVFENNTPKTKTSMEKQSTCSRSRTPVTVQENKISTSNSEDSLLQTSGSNKQWVRAEVSPVEGYVGVCTVAMVKLTSVSEAFLSARLRRDDSAPDDGSLAVDLPRLPVLLKPSVPELLSLTVTAFKPITEVVTIVVQLQDTCEDVENQEDIQLHVTFTLPRLEVVTPENDEIVQFPPTPIGSETVKSFVVRSDCAKPLQLSLSVQNPVFSIGHIEEIKLDDVDRRLSMECRLVNEDGLVTGSKYKAMRHNSKQVRVLTPGKALIVLMTCKAPTTIATGTPKSTMIGSLDVHIVGTKTLLQRVPLSATVGTLKLVVQVTGQTLVISEENHKVVVHNAGSIGGAWRTSVRGPHARTFAVSPAVLRLEPATSAELCISGASAAPNVGGLLVLESVYEGKELTLEFATAGERFTKFPIKCSHSELAWVREGRRDINLKNTSERTVGAVFRMQGDGYCMEYEGATGKEFSLNFGPNEVRWLRVVYSPREKGCHRGRIAIVLKQDADCAKSVRLHGYNPSCGGHVRWAPGVIMCGEVGIVFARRRTPVTLALENKSREPAFYSARLLFNMQYRSLAATCCVTPARGILAPHAATTLSVQVDWTRLARVRDGASTLATLFVLVGPELCRRRVLRILKNDQSADAASSGEELERLCGSFPGEDPRLDTLIQDFEETKRSLPTLMASIRELTAHIELSHDLSGGEQTVVIPDDTCLEQHTLLD